jgi:MbtH protein
MSANPFENEDGIYSVLVNDEGQHSLWPAEIAVPGGWKVVYSDRSRADCLQYIEENWTDMRPRSLQNFMASHPAD